MVDLTIVNPTDNSFPIGNNVNCPAEIGIITIGNPTIGTGTLNTFISNSVSANGNYDINFLNISGSGTWSINITEQSNGSWNLQITLTGTFAKYSQNFTANASTNGNSVLFTNISNPSEVVTLAQDNGGLFTMGKITITISTVSLLTLYICNSTS